MIVFTIKNDYKISRLACERHTMWIKIWYLELSRVLYVLFEIRIFSLDFREVVQLYLQLIRTLHTMIHFNINNIIGCTSIVNNKSKIGSLVDQKLE